MKAVFKSRIDLWKHSPSTPLDHQQWPITLVKLTKERHKEKKNTEVTGVTHGSTHTHSLPHPYGDGPSCSPQVKKEGESEAAGFKRPARPHAAGLRSGSAASHKQVACGPGPRCPADCQVGPAVSHGPPEKGSAGAKFGGLTLLRKLSQI